MSLDKLQECDAKIVAYAVQLRAAQKSRLASIKGSEAYEAAAFIEHMARKKLNEFVDLKIELERMIAQAVEPLKER